MGGRAIGDGNGYDTSHELEVIFPDEEDSNWEWDEQAPDVLPHRFYAEQPDLNVGNPDVDQRDGQPVLG